MTKRTHHKFTVRGGEEIPAILAGACSAIGSARLANEMAVRLTAIYGLDALPPRPAAAIGTGYERGAALLRHVRRRVAKRALTRAARLIRRREKRERSDVHLMNANARIARDRY